MDDDVLALIVVAVVFLGPLMAMLTGVGDGVAGWLTERGILTRSGVLVELAAGAGLDLGRLAVTAGALLALIAWAIRARHRRQTAV